MTREVLKQSITFQLSPDSGVPAYLQLAQQVRQALRMGVLDVGDKLPTVKEVVAEVAVNPNTMLKEIYFTALKTRDRSACDRVLQEKCDGGQLTRVENA